MQLRDFTTLQTIPGFKSILKAVIKAQIQSLVEQLHDQTGEESLLLTASTSDGSLCFLGSGTGQGFLEGRDDIKSQFLSHCLSESSSHKTSLANQSSHRNILIPNSAGTLESTNEHNQKHQHENMIQQNSVEKLLSIECQSQQFPVTISQCDKVTAASSAEIPAKKLYPVPGNQLGIINNVAGSESRTIPVHIGTNEQTTLPVVSMQTVFVRAPTGQSKVFLSAEQKFVNPPIGQGNVVLATDQQFINQSSGQSKVFLSSDQQFHHSSPAQNKVVLHNDQQFVNPSAGQNKVLVSTDQALVNACTPNSQSKLIVGSDGHSSRIVDMDKQSVVDMKDKTKKTLSSKIEEITERIRKDDPQKSQDDIQSDIGSPVTEGKTKGSASKPDSHRPRQRKSGKTKDTSRASHRKPKIPRYNIGAASDEEEASQTMDNLTDNILDIAAGIDDSNSSFSHITLDELRDGVILRENETDIPLVGFTCNNTEDSNKSGLHSVFNLKPPSDLLTSKIQESSEVRKEPDKALLEKSSTIKVTAVPEKSISKVAAKKSLINKKLWLKCSLCPERFPNQETLIQHIQTVKHSLKKYTCDLCGWKFSQLRDKERHRRIHTGERPFKCDICNKAFARKDNLKSHKRKHLSHIKQMPPAGGKQLTTISM